MDLTTELVKNGVTADSTIDSLVHSLPRTPRRPSSVIAGDTVAGALDRDAHKKPGSGNFRRRSNSSSSSSSSGASAYSSVGKSETEKLPFDDVLGKKARFYQQNYECAFCDHETETFGLMLKHIGSAHPWYDLSPHQNIK
ncbi:hypothetical protein FB645_005905 [Coemansia sp. IMI 203386]|nr:hypothetical protein FB645_005905 [Coemansia sp. IMI 203386]